MTQLRHALLAQAVGGFVHGPVFEVIRGWGQYKDTVELLPQPERDKVAKLAELVAKSFTVTGSTPLGQITVVGHADRDSHGAALEQKVSGERAQSVAAALAKAIVAEFKARKLTHSPGFIAFLPSPHGRGARIPDPANVPVVRDRLLNRRVEVIIKTRGAPVPEPDTFEKRINRLIKLLATRRVEPDTTGTRTARAKCILPKFLKPGVVDVFVDGSVANQTINGMTPKSHECIIPGRNVGWLGNYDGTQKPMPNSEFIKFLGTLTPILKGSGFAPSQSDDQVLRVLGAVLQNIDEGINMVDSYINRMGMMTDPIAKKFLEIDGFAGDVARKKLQKLYRDHLNDENNIYSCFK